MEASSRRATTAKVRPSATGKRRAGISFHVISPISNALIHNRYWGDIDDFKNNAFLELHGDLAHSWEQAEDGLQWTLKLRDGVMWNDGTPFTCDDAQWSFNTIRTGEGLNRSPRAVQFLAVDSFSCADDLTLVVDMNRPKPGIIDAIGMPYHAIYPAHKFRGNTESMREDRPEVGTGPFNLKQWIPGEKYVFERKADYWDQPFPYLDGIQVNILANPASDAAIRGRASAHAGRVRLERPAGRDDDPRVRRLHLLGTRGGVIHEPGNLPGQDQGAMEPAVGERSGVVGHRPGEVHRSRAAGLVPAPEGRRFLPSRPVGDAGRAGEGNHGLQLRRPRGQQGTGPADPGGRRLLARRAEARVPDLERGAAGPPADHRGPAGGRIRPADRRSWRRRGRTRPGATGTSTSDTTASGRRASTRT